MRLVRFFLILSVLIASTAIGGEKPVPPDTRGLTTLYGRFAFAHGCPVAPDLMLTNAHVADVFPTVPEFPLVGYRFQNAFDVGVLSPEAAAGDSDVALMRPSVPLTFWYPIAKEAPRPGDFVWFENYDWSSEDRALERVLVRAEVTRHEAGALVYRQEGDNGSSGGCVLNSRDEVIGLNEGALALRNAKASGVAVGLWEPWWVWPEGKEPAPAPVPPPVEKPAQKENGQ